MIKLINGDCLVEMQSIPDKSIDMILCDLPYGTTACKWDTVIPFEPIWKQYKRIIKDRGAIVLFGSEPFSSYLRMSNIKDYKYDWIWQKSRGSNFACFKYQPAKNYEIISVFRSHNFYPILVKRPLKNKRVNAPRVNTSEITGTIWKCEKSKGNDDYKHTEAIIYFNEHRCGLHPTQKPVALLEYLIKTYTLEGETVLDNTMGSGSTGIACLNTNRDFIGIELDKTYFGIATKRINETKGLFDAD